MRALSRIAVMASLLVAAGAAPTGAATVNRERLGDNVYAFGYHSAIAVGSDGVVHRVWREGAGTDTGSVLMYARREFDTWTTEVVDTREPVLSDDNIAIDAEGRVHVNYYWNNREDPSYPRLSVIHAVREAEGWVHTTLASPDVLSGTTMAVDPDGHPHVAWPSGMDESYGFEAAVVATFDGAAWDVADTGFNGMPRDLLIDPEGRSHMTLSGYGGDSWHYLTDASGSWAEETLPLEVGLPRIALDGDGRVHLVGFLVDAETPGTLRHMVRGPDGWEVDETFVDEGSSYTRSDLFLEAGPGPEVHILFLQLSQDTWDGDSERWLVSFDGATWERQPFGARTDSAEVNATAVGPDGILHVVCGGREAPWLDYFRIGGPDLDVDASGLRVMPVKGGVSVRGRIVVRNLDERRSGMRFLRLARSDRDEYRPGDIPVGRDRRIPSLRPRARRSIPVSVLIPDPAPGERLLGAIDPLGRPGSREGPRTVLVLPLEE